MIRFSKVTKNYQRTDGAVSNVSFHVRKGEFAFLTGPSGAGKSTVLRMIYAEEKPSYGEVRVAGMLTNSLKRSDVPRLRRKLGIVFQDFRLLEERTAAENVAFALEVTGAPSASIPGKVNRLLTQVGLVSKAGSYPNELSGGEQQRVAFARALANDPMVIIADEPTGNLDERATRGVFQLLRDINASGTAVIMASHDLDLIRSTEFRTLEMNRGQLVYDSSDGGARSTESGTPARGGGES
jgi:cell division transport system ATP-binding protein